MSDREINLKLSVAGIESAGPAEQVGAFGVFAVGDAKVAKLLQRNGNRPPIFRRSMLVVTGQLEGLRCLKVRFRAAGK